MPFNSINSTSFLPTVPLPIVLWPRPKPRRGRGGLAISDRKFFMAQLFVVHPQNPQTRLLRQASQLLSDGGLVAVPTDSSYAVLARLDDHAAARSEEHTSELQSLMRISYAVICLK